MACLVSANIGVERVNMDSETSEAVWFSHIHKDLTMSKVTNGENVGNLSLDQTNLKSKASIIKVQCFASMRMTEYWVIYLCIFNCMSYIVLY
jgi:hypothetical protein